LEFPYPLLVCDIGGTNTRVAQVASENAPVELLAHLKTADFDSFPDAVRKAAAPMAKSARSLIACGAGPVQGRSLHLTNAAWLLEGPSILSSLELDQGLLLNDFEAQALSLPTLRPDWLKPIGDPKPANPESTAMRLILGPGTGLGVAAVYEFGGRFLPLSSVAGHAGVGPGDEEQERFWPHLERAHGRISAESVISGPGLVRVHRARLLAQGRAAPQMDGVTLVDRALHDRSGEEAKTVRTFWRLTARFAGDMALAFLSRGGLTLGGGVLPRMFALLDAADFRAIFEQKAPMEELAAGITTNLVSAPDAVLAGMAAIAAHPDRYVIDYETRAWANQAA
jgi:glucokinase